MESGCSDRQLNYQMAISDHLWLWKVFSYQLITGSTQLLFCMPLTGRVLYLLKIVLYVSKPAQTEWQCQRQYQKSEASRSLYNFAGAWRCLLHFSWGQNIPTPCRELLWKDRNESRGGKVSLNVKEMAECKEISCEHTDKIDSVWVEIIGTRDDTNSPRRIVLRIFCSLLPLFKLEYKL